jgi:polar amino acid transport system substrate-binding protein
MRPFLLLLLCCTLAAPAQAQDLHLLTEHMPPASMLEDGKVTGRAVEQVRELMRRAGIGYKLDLMPWKRAYTLAQTEGGACVFQATRTPEREALFQWVGPISETDWVLFGRAGRNYKVAALQDAKGLRIGAYAADVRAETLRAQGFDLDVVVNDELNPQKLLMERIDLWVTSTRSAASLLGRLGLAGQVVPVLVFNKVKLYMACGPGVSAAQVKAMNGALDAMRQDGGAKAIDSKYEHWRERAKAGNAQLALVTEQLFPSSMLENGKVIGHAVEKVRDIMRRSDTPYQLELLPWKRAFTMAQTQPDTCVFATSRTPEREAMFKWIGPLLENEWVLYGRAGHQYQLKSLKDALGLRIGSYNADVRGDYLRERGHKVDMVQNDESNPRKLLLDRIDLWVSSPAYAKRLLAKTGLEKQIVPVLTFNRVKTYLACNPSISDAHAAAMNSALEAGKRDGTVRAIEQKYEKWVEKK